MKLRLKTGIVITIMPVPKRKRRYKNDEFEADLDRWIYLTVDERRALLNRMRTYRDTHWARREYFPWAAANFRLPTLPCEGVQMLPHSPAEEAAFRGWSEQSEKIWAIEKKWPLLTIAERAEALVLAELMAADLPIARGLRDWMKANLEAAVPSISPGSCVQHRAKTSARASPVR
jgi:hypothetical protein